MKKRTLSSVQHSTLNIVACLSVVFMNIMISLLLSPFIVSRLGVEANGFLSLANNFISYLGLITLALNSMGGRFMLIDIVRGDRRSANQYYSSVWLGNLILAAILIIPCIMFVVYIDNFINIDLTLLSDVKALFALVFLSFFLKLIIPKWSTVEFITDKLYLRSLKNLVSTIVRVICIVVAFLLFKPAVYYVAIAGIAMTFVNCVIEYNYKNWLMPELCIKRNDFDFCKIRILISAGIWNSITRCGNLLMEGIDLLIANLFVSAFAMGVMSVSKIIPNMLNQITSNVATTFTPKLTRQYAEGNILALKKSITDNIKVVSILATIVVGVTTIVGKAFFILWMPSQDAKQLLILSLLTMVGTACNGISCCVSNIFSVINKLRVNSLVILLAGFINVLLVYLVLKITNLGVYAIAGISTAIIILRSMCFTLPYAAHCLGLNIFTFHFDLIKGMSMVIIPIIFSSGIAKLFNMSTWIGFFTVVILATMMSLAADILIFFNDEEKKALMSMLIKKQ